MVPTLALLYPVPCEPDRRDHPPSVAEAPWRAPESAETIVRNSLAKIRIGGERAFYSPAPDHIQMPPQRAFRSPAAWASVQLHELAHCSWSATRLNRDLSGGFGSTNYSRKELRAELAQVMICAELGIEDCDFTNGATYVAHWVSKLRDDKKELFRAAADGQRIADFLLAFHPDFAVRNTQRDPSPQEAPGTGRREHAEGRCLKAAVTAQTSTPSIGEEHARSRTVDARLRRDTNLLRLSDPFRRGPRSKYPRLDWIVEAFLNGTLPAARRDPKTGMWQDRYLAGRSDTALVRSLRDGRRYRIAVRVLILHEEHGLAAQPCAYPDLPDTRLYRLGARPDQRAALDAGRLGSR